MKSVLKFWAPAILWIAVVNVMSIGAFSATQTGNVLYWIFTQLGIPQQDWAFLHFLVRKAAHVTEYSILSGTLFWSLRGTTLPGVRSAWHLHWARTAWVISALVAILDELHQSFVPERSPAVHDVLLDAGAAAAVQVALWLVFRGRPRNGRDAGRIATTTEAPTSA